MSLPERLMWLLWLPALLFAAWLLLLLGFAAPLRARWREPVFRHPLLILESDDWGAGPLEQAQALQRIAQTLAEFRDAAGRAPVMTLGVVLEVPDTAQIAHDKLRAYHALTLAQPPFDTLRANILQSMADGVFAPQLHGQAHYWPAALMAAAHRDRAVADWLTAPGLPQTEALRAALQSRWIDASELPSRALAPAEIDAAVAAEAALYQRCLNVAPRVAVATTFVWNDAVESAWRRAGVEVIITPGRRATLRDAAGQPAGHDRVMLTGERAPCGARYLVRDVYFEPALGHMPQRLVEGLAARTRQGRACLVEMHRFNFLPANGADARVDASLACLRDGLAASLSRFPDLRFIAPLELARAIERADATLIAQAFKPRLRAWLARLAEIPRFPRLARASGLGAVFALMARVA